MLGGLWLIFRLFLVFAFADSGEDSGVDSGDEFRQELHYFRLDNGLQVILSVNDSLPVVNQTLWYRVGSIDEPPLQSGIAHLLEHLMFKGTETIASGEFSAIISALGGEENAATSRYYTSYYQTIASEHWPRMAELEADRMRNLRFGANDIETEVKVVYEERLMRTENNPAAILSERVQRALHQNHPAGKPVIGWGHELLALVDKPDFIRAFYRHHYSPNNAILAVSGAISLASAKAVIAETYGKIPKAPSINSGSLIAIEPPSQTTLEVSLQHANVSQSLLGVNLLVPSFGYHNGIDARIPQKRKDILPLLIIANIFDSPNFSLYDDFVKRQKSAFAFASYYSPMGRGPGIFAFYLYPTDADDIRNLQAELQAKLHAIVSTGLSPSDIQSAKIRITDSLLLSYDSLSGYTDSAAKAMLSGLSFEEFLHLRQEFDDVSVADVNATLHRYFAEDSFVGVWSFLRGEAK